MKALHKLQWMNNSKQSNLKTHISPQEVCQKLQQEIDKKKLVVARSWLALFCQLVRQKLQKKIYKNKKIMCSKIMVSPLECIDIKYQRNFYDLDKKNIPDKILSKRIMHVT